MKTITIKGQLRTGFGKTATRQLRSQEQVPGVIYGGTQEINFSAPAVAFKPLVYTPSFQLAELDVDGKIYKCILKDLQFDSDKPWVTGNVPELIPVNVEGDTIQVHALFKGECFDKEYKLRIYVEYEEAETIVMENSEEQNRDKNCDLEPQEIHL